MSLSCDCGIGDGDYAWWYAVCDGLVTLDTKRSRRCCSCKTRINVGDMALPIERWRDPIWDVEHRIYLADHIYIATWYFCETCAGLYWAIDERGMCVSIEEPIADQIREYVSEYGPI